MPRALSVVFLLFLVSSILRSAKTFRIAGMQLSRLSLFPSTTNANHLHRGGGGGGGGVEGRKTYLYSEQQQQPEVASELDTMAGDKDKKEIMVSTGTAHSASLFTTSTFTIAMSLLIGMILYVNVDGFDLATSYYYACSSLFGVLYGVPQESPSSQSYTLALYLFGSSLLAGAVGAFASELVRKATHVKAKQRRRFYTLTFPDEPIDLDGDGVVSLSEKVVFHLVSISRRLKWEDHGTKYVSIAFALGWIMLGILYGTSYESWSLNQSLFFSLSAVSGSGLMPPVCEGSEPATCTVSSTRAIFTGTYIAIGVPLFAYTLSNFASFFVENAIKQAENERLMKPLTRSEIDFAVDFFGQRKPTSDGSTARLDLGDFVVLELLRSNKVEREDLHHIKTLFEEIDDDKSGWLEENELLSHNFLDADRRASLSE